MSWRQMIFYRPELVGLVTYIYKIVPHTHTGVYVPLVLRLVSARGAGPAVRASSGVFRFRRAESHLCLSQYYFGISFIQLLADTG